MFVFLWILANVGKLVLGLLTLAGILCVCLMTFGRKQ